MKNNRRKFLIVCWWVFYLWIGSTLYSGQGWAPEVSMTRSVLRVTYPLSVLWVQVWIKTGKQWSQDPDALGLSGAQVPLVVLPTLAAAVTTYLVSLLGVGVLLTYIGRFFSG